MADQHGPTSTVRVGRGGVNFLFVAVAVFIAAVYTQNNLLFWSFGLMVGGVLVAAVLAQLMLRGIEVHRELPDHLVAGERTTIHYAVRSQQRLMPAFGIVMLEVWAANARVGSDSELPEQLATQPACWLLHLGPGQTQHVASPVTPQHRGAMAFRRVLVQSSFPFGIFKRTLTYDQPADVLVYPPLYRLDRQLMASLSAADYQGQSAGDKPGGGEEFYGLRQYRPGDSLRTVDWKRSASRTTMVSREHEMPHAPKVNIALDLSRATDAHVKLTADDNAADLQLSESPCERAISLAASLICEAYLRGCEVGLTVWGVDAPVFRPHHNLPHRTQMLDALCRLDLTQTTSSQSGSADRGTSVIVTTDDRPSGRRDGARVLSASRMADYVLGREADGQQLLTTSVKTSGRATRRLQKEVAG